MTSDGVFLSATSEVLPNQHALRSTNRLSPGSPTTAATKPSCTVIQLAHELGMDVVAEGVETSGES
jgi:hypothetical protein